MSIRALLWAGEQDGSREARSVLRVLSHMANGETMETWPTNATIAWHAGLSVDQVRAALAELRAAGLVQERDAAPLMHRAVRVLVLQVPGLVGGVK